MALNIEQKKAVVSEMADVAANALSVVAAEYRGMTVGQMTELRAKARDDGIYLRVAKNTLVRRAVAGTDFECIQEGLSGPLLFAFSNEDPGAGARLIKEFAKSNDNLVAKLLSVDGEMLPGEQLDRLASLPNREQALSMLLGVMKAPIEKFVRTLAEPPAKLARAVAAVRDQKQAA